MKSMLILRHSIKGKGEDEDTLTPEGVHLAVATGSSMKMRRVESFTLGISSGCQRTTQTIACILAEFCQAIPSGIIVNKGLSTPRIAEWDEAIEKAGSTSFRACLSVTPSFVQTETARMAHVLKEIFAAVPFSNDRILAVGHNLLIECGVYGRTDDLSKIPSEPLKECAGYEIFEKDDHSFSAEFRSF